MRERFKRLAAVWLVAIMVVMFMVPTAAAVQFTITKQPTADDPSVGVTSTVNVSYQWYKKGVDYEITNKDIGSCVEYVHSCEYIEDVNGWVSTSSGYIEIGFAELSTNKGDVFTLTFSPEVIRDNEFAAAMLKSGDLSQRVDFGPTGNEAVYTAEIPDAEHRVLVIEGIESGYAKIEMTGFIPIAGENSDTLSNPEDGKEYHCIVMWKDDDGNVVATATSDSFIVGEEDNDRWNIWPWILLLTRAVRYYDGDDLVHTARAWKENPLEAVYEPEAREGYTFAGWYTDNDFTEKFDFTKPLTLSKRVYAKWDKN